MFKKRLKGLLAMVLAGSIAATTLPLSASAVISGYALNGEVLASSLHELISTSVLVIVLLRQLVRMLF